MGEYMPIEYPKWVDGVLLKNEAEEQAHRTPVAEAAEVARAAELARPPSPAAIRMRRSRKRRRAGQRCVPFVVCDHEIEALVTSGLLNSVARNDSHAIGTALGKLVDRLPPKVGR
jgi:hypothetical protein